MPWLLLSRDSLLMMCVLVKTLMHIPPVSHKFGLYLVAVKHLSRRVIVHPFAIFCFANIQSHPAKKHCLFWRHTRDMSDIHKGRQFFNVTWMVPTYVGTIFVTLFRNARHGANNSGYLNVAMFEWAHKWRRSHNNIF